MRNDKNHALKLRIAGKSYNEISQMLNIPKSTLSGWFGNLELSEKARERLKKRVHEASVRGLLKRNRHQTQLAIQRAYTIKKGAHKEIGKLSFTELKLIGAALYWAEGYKRLQIRNGREVTSHAVALTNSDPALIKLFLKFLREVCKVTNDQIRADIRIYEHMDEKQLLNFWQEITKLPKENFGKFYYGISKSSLGKRPYNRLPHGTILIRVNRTNLFYKIMGWIEGLADRC